MAAADFFIRMQMDDTLAGENVGTAPDGVSPDKTACAESRSIGSSRRHVRSRLDEQMGCNEHWISSFLRQRGIIS